MIFLLDDCVAARIISFALITGAASSFSFHVESNRNFGREHSRLPLGAREPSQLRLEKKTWTSSKQMHIDEPITADQPIQY